MATHSNMISHHMFIIDAQNIPEIAGVWLWCCHGTPEPRSARLGMPRLHSRAWALPTASSNFCLYQDGNDGIASIYIPYQMKNSQVWHGGEGRLETVKSCKICEILRRSCAAVSGNDIKKAGQEWPFRKRYEQKEVVRTFTKIVLNVYWNWYRPASVN